MAYLVKGFVKKRGEVFRSSSPSYPEAINKLNQELNSKAQEVQKITEAKESSLKEVGTLIAKQARLDVENADLEKEIKHRKLLLEEESEKRISLITSATKELKKEDEKLSLVRRALTPLEIQVKELSVVAEELRSYLDKKKDARKDYLVEKEKLTNAQKEYKVVSTEALQRSKEINTKNKELDNYREVMKDWSGRLTTSLGKVTQATRELNERLVKEGIPVEFALPPENKIVIPFE